MENTEHDNKGSAWVPGFEVMGQGIVGAKHESMSQDACLTQDGNVLECSRAMQTDRCSSMLTNTHLFSRSNMTSMDATRELLSSLNASPVTLSGLYCTGMEASVKDGPPSIRVDPAILSGLYCSEGVVKDCSAITASNNSTAGPGILSSPVHEIKIPGFNSTTCHTQRPWLPQKPQNYQLKNVEKEASSHTSVRVARPPGEGRGKNQLLPRYWPRITDQELQSFTNKDSNSTIIPLFEKVLSASDAGKIGRLVLPKACAEAYFPPISQAEGLPITVQDISGKDWTFQFRFWPNNNSRMYVLEGITPCIQSMHLQAGDTVIFSRRDPEGKLVMGYRRASNMSSVEETQKMAVVGSSVAPSSQMFSRNLDKLSTVASATGVLSQSIKSSSKAQVPRNSGQITNLQVADPGYGLPKAGMTGPKTTRESSPYNLTNSSEKRKAKEISSKQKKPKSDADSLEFKMNWEEAQSLLRSPPNVIPSIVTIEGYDFEEYEDPPVFGKEAIPVGSLPKKFCNPQQGGIKNTPEFLSQHIKAKKQALVETLKESEALSGLETLANLAAAEENMNVASSSSPAAINAAAAAASSPATNSAAAASCPAINKAASSSPATTTKHPRHRPGCSCIVCIQPPSGKGPKHKPTCDCNVCMTVKRRFHTLMLRRKKLQSEREAESSSQKNQHSMKEGMESAGGRKPNEISAHKNGSWHGECWRKKTK
eukprot:c22279_g1_i1 orf=180-2306(+)